MKILQSRIRTIRSGDPLWMLNDGVIISPRAGFEINPSCPREYRMIIAECVNNGWIKPVANVYDHEQTFDTLKGVCNEIA